MARDPVFGGSTREPFAIYDPDTCSWRTCQLCLVEGYVAFSGTWPRSGTMRSGIAYPLPTLARRISEIESGLLPTPTARDWRSESCSPEVRAEREAHPRGKSLAWVTRWPTPMSSERDQSPKALHARQSQPRGGCALAHADDQRELQPEGSFSPTSGDGLATAVKKASWPTPQAHDATIGHPERVGRYGTEHGGRNLNDSAALSEGRSGALNPTWVEWLMGFPLGWTDLEDSATP